MDREAFELKVSALRGRLLSAARSMLPHDDCEDAVQSAVLSAWEHRDQLRSEASFDAWLMQILRNRCKQILRRRAKDSALRERLSQAESPAAAQPDLSGALDSLRNEEKSLLLMHHEQGYSLSEMADMTGQSKDVIKMRLYRARKRLRIALFMLLLLLLLAAAAIGTGYLDVNWFLQNRRASNPPLYKSDSRSVFDISYDGLFLDVEMTDAVWDLDALRLSITYTLTGISSDALTVHSGCIGVDGERFDHIWVDDHILPVLDWADGKTVYTFTLDGWQLGSRFLLGSEDYLADGKGEAFYAAFFLDSLTPEHYAQALDEKHQLTLTLKVLVEDYASGELLEEGLLTAHVSAPDADAWRIAYESHAR